VSETDGESPANDDGGDAEADRPDSSAPEDAAGGRHGLAELIAQRRAKAERLIAAGHDVAPYSYRGSEPIHVARDACETLEEGQETDEIHRVAGRIAARRGAGGSAFLDIVDRSGRIQLHARLDVLGQQAFEALSTLDLGDIVGVEGAAMRARKRGEPTLRVERFEVLAKALRPPPDKRLGLTDVETRHRKRELDLIANEEARRLFVDRASIVRAIRGELDEAGFVEVETPILQPLYGGALARPFTTHHNALDRDLYLRIAPELYLKRLIVGGLEKVYELGKDFRNEGLSTKHNPEFTMVEWYEAYADYLDEAGRLEAIVAAAAESVSYDGEIDFSAPWRRLSFVESVQEATGIDLLAHEDAEDLAAAVKARRLGVQVDGLSWPQIADELLSKHVEPELRQPTFVLDYPVELSPFARAHRSKPRLAERWEAFLGGMEVANAFSELTDPDEQRRRFEAQRRLAIAGDEETQPHDEAFLEALEMGMPPTGGVGLGVDRLVMALTGRSSIREVVLFPAMRT